MTVETAPNKEPTLHPNGKVVGKTYLSAARKRMLFREMAAGERSLKWLADRYNISYQYCRELRANNAEEIAEIAAELGEELTKHVFTDKLERIKELCLDIEAIQEQMDLVRSEDVEFGTAMAAPEHWQRLAMTKKAFIKDLNELLGELPQRQPAVSQEAAVRVIHEIGVDMSRAFPQPS